MNEESCVNSQNTDGEGWREKYLMPICKLCTTVGNGFLNLCFDCIPKLYKAKVIQKITLGFILLTIVTIGVIFYVKYGPYNHETDVKSWSTGIQLEHFDLARVYKNFGKSCRKIFPTKQHSNFPGFTSSFQTQLNLTETDKRKLTVGKNSTEAIFSLALTKKLQFPPIPTQDILVNTTSGVRWCFGSKESGLLGCLDI